MTSAPISDFTVTGISRSQKSAESYQQDHADELVGSFQNAMSQAQQGQAKPADDRKTAGVAAAAPVSVVKGSERTGMVPVAKTGSTETAGADKGQTVKTQEAEQAPGEGMTAENTAKTEDTASTETAEETLQDVEEEVVDKIAGELDVSEEEVLEAMKALGLTVTDLTDQGNMAALAAKLTGEGDPLLLVTDGELYETVQELTDAVGDILEEGVETLSEALGVSKEEAVQLLEQAAAASVPKESVPVVEIHGEVFEAAKENVPEAAGREQAEPVLDGPVVSAPKSAEGGKDAGEQSGMQYEHDGAQAANPMMPRFEALTPEVPVAETGFSSYVDTEDIIRQIADYVRINNSQGLSEMEISLHPESLGNIHLQVAAKEGVVTAVITTQNEAVREALMVQAMVLKEELNEQGVKVEAVEVTVASHEFERSMDEAGEQAQDMYRKETEKQTRRRLVVESLSEAEELLASDELSDAERLQVDMMAKSGNSVDFTA